MRRASHAIAVVLASFFMLAFAAATPGLAQADDGSVPWRWDGDTINLAWDGSAYATSSSSFLGAPVVSPGDHLTRTAAFTNAGPSAAVATVQIVDVTVTTPDGAANTDLQDCVHLTASSGGRSVDTIWRQAATGASDVNAYGERVSWQTQFNVPQGGDFTVTLGAYFPAGETGGNGKGQPSQILSAHVRVSLVGETPTSPTPGPSHPSYISTGGGTGALMSHHQALIGALVALAVVAAVVLRRHARSRR